MDFHDPRVSVVVLRYGHIGKIVKMLNFIKNLLLSLYSWVKFLLYPLGMEQTNLVMMNKEFDDPQSL